MLGPTFTIEKTSLSPIVKSSMVVPLADLAKLMAVAFIARVEVSARLEVSP